MRRGDKPRHLRYRLAVSWENRAAPALKKKKSGSFWLPDLKRID
jgi:hypothetical protein